MAMDLPTLRKLVALDANDPLSRFALGKKLLELNENLEEAAEHLKFANEKNPSHLASYHVRSQILIKLGRTAEARPVLEEGIRRVSGIGEGMGRDLGPAMQEMLDSLK